MMIPASRIALITFSVTFVLTGILIPVVSLSNAITRANPKNRNNPTKIPRITAATTLVQRVWGHFLA